MALGLFILAGDGEPEGSGFIFDEGAGIVLLSEESGVIFKEEYDEVLSSYSFLKYRLVSSIVTMDLYTKQLLILC